MMTKLEIVLSLCLVVIVALFGSLLKESWHWPTDEQVGMTYSQIATEIEKCEIVLPRYENCVVKIEVVKEKK